MLVPRYAGARSTVNTIAHADHFSVEIPHRRVDGEE
jgi:hypothetical protein